MQSLKDLPWTKSSQKPTLKFLSNQKTRQSLPFTFSMCKSEKQPYICHLFDSLHTNHSPTRFQLNCIRTQITKFSVKTVGHCCDFKIIHITAKATETSESAMNRRSSTSSTIRQSLTFIYHIYGAWLNLNAKVFNKPRHLSWPTKKAC